MAPEDKSYASPASDMAKLLAAIEKLQSEVADINNVGQRGGGAITAALFLKEFAGDTPWAHLDIAGPAFTERDTPLAPKGGTGVAVRTLLAYLTADK